MERQAVARVFDVNPSMIVVGGILIGLTLSLSVYVYQTTEERIFREHLSSMDGETVRLVADVNNRISLLSLAISATAKHIVQAARNGANGSSLGTLRPYPMTESSGDR